MSIINISNWKFFELMYKFLSSLLGKDSICKYTWQITGKAPPLILSL